MSRKAISFGDTNDIERLVSLGGIIRKVHPKTECGLKTFSIGDANLKDSLSRLNISALSIKYLHDTITSNEYFYGNKTKLPDSCIIFSKDDYKANKDKVASTMLFYFFGKIKPVNFKFRTYEPVSERTMKINDSTWIYNSVHQLIVIH